MNRIIKSVLNRRAFIASASAGIVSACASPLSEESGTPPSSSGSAGTASAPVVETRYGRIRGAREEGVLVFKGVPYGASTAGANRFRPPKAPAPWTGVKDATAFGAACPQASMKPPPRPPGAPPIRSLTVIADETQSEDCLVLNVWTKSLSGKKPVMFWLHGGGYATGSAAPPVYDGVNLAARQDVVMVSINHRLNVLGYFYLDDVSKGQYVDSASVGILDAVLALQWVRDNIEKFGGDPARVMIFGESGGGAKVSTLMGMVPAQGLFHRAVMQSGSQLKVATKDEANENTLKVLQKLEIKPNELHRLETLPIEVLRAAATQGNPFAPGPRLDFRPVAGTPALPNHPFDPTASMLSANVPLIVGDNRTETSVFMGNDPAVLNLDEATLLKRLGPALPPGEAPQVIAMYRRLYPNAKPEELLYMVTTDRGSFLSTTLVGERKAALARAPAYVYGFYRHSPVDNGRWYVPHGAELPFVFDTLRYGTTWGDPTPQAQVLADQMSAAWANFARTGDPSGGSVPTWPSYNANTRPTMIFDEPPAGSRVENDPRSEQRKRMLGYGMST